MELPIRSLRCYVFLLPLLQIVLQATCTPLLTFLHPNFTASRVKHIDNYGAFLRSSNGTFRAAIVPGSQPTLYYVSVIHFESNTVIWTANGANPMGIVDEMRLTINGINIYSSGALVWSTPSMPSTSGEVSGMQLFENGNLVLLNKFGKFVWQSFDYPTDTIVTGQMLPVGRRLFSPVSSTNLSIGDYSLLVVDKDVVMLWKDQIYWRLSSSPIAVLSANYRENSYLRVNQSGLHIPSDDNMMQKSVRLFSLDYVGRLKFYSMSNKLQEIHVEPTRECLLPLSCGFLGLCLEFGTRNNVSVSCSCSAGIGMSTIPSASSGCLLPQDSISPSCTESNDSSSSVSYLKLEVGTQYFANDFKQPTISNVSLNACQNLCSKSCSCSGFFYANLSSNCVLLPEQLGSLKAGDNQSSIGYLKLVKRPEAVGRSHWKRVMFAWLLICLVPVLVMLTCALLCAYYIRKLPITSHKTALSLSNSDAELDALPGLPVRYSYKELLEFTNNFNNPIGAGGFGIVYKGTTTFDHTEVAVKKISIAGKEGKEGFSAEVRTLAHIRHVNLVKLRGFCTVGLDHFLVYEFVNRGSLDHLLFESETILGWPERVEIALGIARGLAYLHEGCSSKILHLDVKPANILLSDNFQVKIGDFGLSKLLSPEQSKLFTALRGTRGYLAPEWLTHGTGISDKTDVYSFGMVLLEIIKGSKNCSVVKEENGVLRWAYFPMLALEMYKKGRCSELADSRLEGKVKYEQVEMLVKLALCCLHMDPQLRPKMTNVVRIIDGEMAVGVPHVKSLKYLKFYCRRSINENANEPSATSTDTKCDMPLLSYLSSEQLSGPR